MEFFIQLVMQAGQSTISVRHVRRASSHLTNAGFCPTFQTCLWPNWRLPWQPKLRQLSRKLWRSPRRAGRPCPHRRICRARAGWLMQDTGKFWNSYGGNNSFLNFWLKTCSINFYPTLYGDSTIPPGEPHWNMINRKILCVFFSISAYKTNQQQDLLANRLWDLYPLGCWVNGYWLACGALRPGSLTVVPPRALCSHRRHLGDRSRCGLWGLGKGEASKHCRQIWIM